MQDIELKLNGGLCGTIKIDGKKYYFSGDHYRIIETPDKRVEEIFIKGKIKGEAHGESKREDDL